MLAPFNLQKWIDENRDLLKPPVSNRNLYVDAGDFIVMILYVIRSLSNFIQSLSWHKARNFMTYFTV